MIFAPLRAQPKAQASGAHALQLGQTPARERLVIVGWVSDGAKVRIAELAGFPLADVKVGLFHTVFHFASGRSVFVTITKAFRFRLPGADWMGCDPASDPKGGVQGEVEFVRLVGQTCRRADLGDHELAVVFEEGGELRVELSPEDFEPLEIMGDTPEHGLLFHHVL